MRWSRILTHCVRLTTLCKCLLRKTEWIARRTTNSRLVLRFASFDVQSIPFGICGRRTSVGLSRPRVIRAVLFAWLGFEVPLVCNVLLTRQSLICSSRRLGSGSQVADLGLLHSCTSPLRVTAVAFSVSLGSRTYTRIQRRNTIRSKKALLNLYKGVERNCKRKFKIQISLTKTVKN